ncbi:MAG: 2-amino-4-hydroxy-6-hydroxymethyldihydropteridine diphosphokinase [Fervidobacterium sp.]
MIVGIGNDILEISRINLKLMKRILTDEEIQNAKKLTEEYLAGRFVLKECYFKALGTGINGSSFKDISFLNRKDGSLYAKLNKYVKPRPGTYNFIHITLSHDSFAIGNVILEKNLGNVYIALGTNLGNREQNIKKALEYLKEVGNIIKISSIIETKAYGKKDQPDFLNCVVELDTDIPPIPLLKKLIEIEHAVGRVRAEKWGPRIIDLDILFYGNLVLNINSENKISESVSEKPLQVNLTVPHYDFENREFFVTPMKEIAPYFVHPISGLTMEDYSKNF